MLRLALGLGRRGHRVAVACPEAPDERGGLAAQARAAGLPPALVVSRGRRTGLLRDGRDAAALHAYLRRERVDLVHTWHTRDHLLALRARRGTGAALVRSWRRAEPPSGAPWNRWLFGPGCDGLWCVSPGSAARAAALRGGRPVAGGFGAVDLERFAPGSPAPGIRASLGLAEEDRVVGIVARVQPQRRFDLLLDAAERLVRLDPRARLLVVGRGTHRERVAVEPARRRGLAERVLFAGYRADDYDQVLRAIDVFTLLVPGSDGTCRAVLEAMACGIPAVTTGRGALPEIVVDGETGRVVAEDPDALAGAWARLLADEALRKEQGEAAARRARTLFAPQRLAEGVEALYAAVRGSA
jgi:glycosyltransferase involved in cell wall biosynthesis